MNHDTPTPPVIDTDPHPVGAQRFVGRAVSFDHVAEPGATASRLHGVVSAAVYIGRTVRGQLPDYSLTIRGKSGRTLTVSLVESAATFPQ